MAAVSAAALRRWPLPNPFSVRGTALPPGALLAAKLIALVFLVLGDWRLTGPFVPFVGFLADIASPSTFQLVLQVVWLTAAALLFFNQLVRASCLVLGGVIFVGLLASQAYRTNNLTFTALVFLLIGLSDRKTCSALLRGQFVVLYFFAGMNKLLDADWQSGAFFQSWAAIHSHGATYLSLAAHLPGKLLSGIFDWVVIGTELVLAAMFALRRLVPAGILLVIAYHSTLFLVNNSTFTMFWYALVATAIALVSWPEHQPVVVYGHGALARVASILRRIDIGGAFAWRHEGAVALEVEDRGRRYRGVDAIDRLLLFQPTLYAAFFVLVALPQPQPRWAAVVAICLSGYAAVRLAREALGHDARAVAPGVDGDPAVSATLDQLVT